MVVQGVEVIGVIGETCHELRSSRGEVPLVLAIVVDRSVIVEEVLVFGYTDLVLRLVVDKQIAIGVVVPLGTNAHIEVSHQEIQGSRLEGMMVVSDVIALRTILIDVHIVATEDIGHRGTQEAGGVEAPVGFCHDAFAESECEVDLHRHLCTERQGSIGLQRHHLLVVEA